MNVCRTLTGKCAKQQQQQQQQQQHSLHYDKNKDLKTVVIVGVDPYDSEIINNNDNNNNNNNNKKDVNPENEMRIRPAQLASARLHCHHDLNPLFLPNPFEMLVYML